MAGLWFGRGWNAHTSEPMYQLDTGIVIVMIACCMLWLTWRESQPHKHHDHNHVHDHHHEHDHLHDHLHDHHHGSSSAAPLVAEEWQDAHQRAHA
ncbi:nickel/cobalt efflux protein RcnA, partial [Klebsiella pneumoniae]|nr:nickel/cobalt efflux protein RcnA [Klebsiella pneumoniae]